jgi:hypothetical protein
MGLALARVLPYLAGTLTHDCLIREVVMADEAEKPSRLRRLWIVVSTVAFMALYFYFFVYEAKELKAWLSEHGIHMPWNYITENRKVTW